MILLLDDEVLGGTQRNVGDSETVGVIESGTPWNSADRALPVETAETERCCQLEVAAEGAFAIFIHAVVAREVGEPLYAEETEVVADISFPDVSGPMGFVLEVATIGEPVVGDADIEASGAVS